MKFNKREIKDNLIGYSFIAPQMLGFIFFVLIPLVMIILYSFESKNLLFGTSSFVGTSNYRDLMKDNIFKKTLINTIVFSLGVVPLNLVLSLGMALYLGAAKRGYTFIRSIVFLPVVTSGVAWAIVWKYLLGADGVINWVLELINVVGPNWLYEQGWAMFSVIVTRVMKNLGMNILIFMGAVMNLPTDVLEAAKLDGAHGLKLLNKIKLPLLMPSILMVSIVTIIGSMRVFDTIKLMTDGGPQGSTMVLVYYIYHQAFKMFNTGYASAISVFLFVIVLGLTIVQWFCRKKVSYYEN